MEVRKTVTFDAAHCLPNYNGKCARLHGHRWTLHVSVKGSVDHQTGMVVDFNELGSWVKSITSRLDHSYLNEKVPLPTAENLLNYLGFHLRSLVDWSRLELEESPGSSCILERSEYEASYVD